MLEITWPTVYYHEVLFDWNERTFWQMSEVYWYKGILHWTIMWLFCMCHLYFILNCKTFWSPLVVDEQEASAIDAAPAWCGHIDESWWPDVLRRSGSTGLCVFRTNAIYCRPARICIVCAGETDIWIQSDKWSLGDSWSTVESSNYALTLSH